MKRLLLALAVMFLAPLGVNAQTVHQSRSNSEFFFTNFNWVEPYNIHRGIWEDVRVCLDLPETITPDDIRWGVADMIVNVRDGIRAYGLSQFVRDDETGEYVPYAIVMEELYGFNATVVSHEINHILYYQGVEPPNACIMHTEDPLDVRYVDPSIIDYLLEADVQVLHPEVN